MVCAETEAHKVTPKRSDATRIVVVKDEFILIRVMSFIKGESLLCFSFFFYQDLKIILYFFTIYQAQST